MLRIRLVRKRRPAVKAKAKAIVAVPPAPKPTPSPPFRPTGPMHRIFLNSDILVVICSRLQNTTDRLAFISTSRWCRLVLKNIAYTRTVLHPDGPSRTLLPVLLEDTARCSHILHLEVWMSNRHQYAYVPGRDDIQQMWRQRQEFVRDVHRVLKQATRLQTLCVREDENGAAMPEELLLAPKSGELPFSLSSCRVARPTAGMLEFLETQTAITHLVLPRRSNHPYDIEGWQDSFSYAGNLLPSLHKLWATPWWMRALLMRAPIRTLGLTEDPRAFESWTSDPDSTEARMLSTLLEELKNMGGHPTVTALAIPVDAMFKVFHTKLPELSEAFPRVQKLAVTLEPGRIFYPEALALIISALVSNEGLNSIFESVREFCFLAPGTWPHETADDDPPFEVPIYRERNFAVPSALLKIMPQLVHVDTTHTCYSRLGAGVRHPGYGCKNEVLGGVDPVGVLGQELSKCDSGKYRYINMLTRAEDVVWFGRPRGDCPLSKDWC
ncbi:hypothetical protein BDV93DRAFT_603105 [Ceratobasidium sp. AG-I]|nr:hypothetical protein BDV93DRAFT_603105 [Ceratobasidium sp. AG-I]